MFFERLDVFGNSRLADVQDICSFGKAEVGGYLKKYFVTVAEHVKYRILNNEFSNVEEFLIQNSLLKLIIHYF